MRTKVRTRSTSVIKHETESVKVFSDPVSKLSFDVRRLSDRDVRQHFIVTLADFDSSSLRVKPVAEIYFAAHKPRFMVKISTQYPNLKNREQYLQEQILNTVSCYEKEHAANFSTTLF
ncbi:hypothetical protein QPB21_001248 [Vibrio alginolyticus]|nr:hypothetical protein [Vibrio alginolyticus]